MNDCPQDLKVRVKRLALLIIVPWGSGTLNILDWCRANHNPPPRWEESRLDFTVTFWPVREAAAAQDQPKTSPRPDAQTEPAITIPPRGNDGEPHFHIVPQFLMNPSAA